VRHVHAAAAVPAAGRRRDGVRERHRRAHEPGRRRDETDDGVASQPAEAEPGLPFVVGLLAAALVLRPQLTAIGPLLPRLQAGLGVGHAAAGLLVTVPIACMGLFGLTAARVMRRVTVRAAVGGCIVTITLAAILRALVPGYAGVLLLTFPFGIAAGVVGALLPAVVGERFAGRLTLGTGLFALSLNAGASAGAGLAVPLADVAGGWRWSLGVLAAVGALAIPAWYLLSPRSLGGGVRAVAHERLPWRSTVAWAAATVFALQAVCFFALNAWLADAMVERGWSEGRAGALAALLNVGPLAGVALVSLAGGRVRFDVFFSAAAGGLLAGTVAVAANADGVWVWVGIASVSLGALFTLAMTLPPLVARRAHETAAVAGLQLGVGYTVAAVAPLALGILRDETGSFGAGLWLVVGVAVLLQGAVLVASRLLRAAVA
jgi:MFS transporter, CP family, cyanate transporter